MDILYDDSRRCAPFDRQLAADVDLPADRAAHGMFHGPDDCARAAQPHGPRRQHNQPDETAEDPRR